MKKIALIMIAGSVLIFNSCTKKGPQGPAGPQGNANVIGSDPFTVTSWGYSGADIAYKASFNDADITANVASNGVVEVFLYYPSDQTWKSLPDLDIVIGSEFFFRFNQGGFDIYFSNVDGTVPVSPASLSSTGWTFRSVVIAPSLKQSHPNTNWRNYNEVMSVLNEASTTSANTTVAGH